MRCNPFFKGVLVTGYDDMLWMSLLDCIPEPKGFVVQTRKKIRYNIASGGVYGVWDNQAGSQKWLPTPNASDRLNSDSPVVETKSNT